MKRYDIRVRYSFEGTYTVAAEDRDEAKRMVNDDCGLVLGGDIHTTRDDDEVLDWDFCIHPDTRILSLQERGGKGSLPSEAVDFSGRIKELRGDIIDAIRQLLHAHCVKEIRLPEEDYDPVWVIWFGKNGEPYECRVLSLKLIDLHNYIYIIFNFRHLEIASRCFCCAARRYQRLASSMFFATPSPFS